MWRDVNALALRQKRDASEPGYRPRRAAQSCSREAKEGREKPYRAHKRHGVPLQCTPLRPACSEAMPQERYKSSLIIPQKGYILSAAVFPSDARSRFVGQPSCPCYWCRRAYW